MHGLWEPYTISQGRQFSGTILSQPSVQFDSLAKNSPAKSHIWSIKTVLEGYQDAYGSRNIQLAKTTLSTKQHLYMVCILSGLCFPFALLSVLKLEAWGLRSHIDALVASGQWQSFPVLNSHLSRWISMPSFQFPSLWRLQLPCPLFIAYFFSFGTVCIYGVGSRIIHLWRNELISRPVPRLEVLVCWSQYLHSDGSRLGFNGRTATMRYLS